MKGECKNCKKQDECQKAIGIIFGYCETDFIPNDTEEREVKKND